ncbi:MAG TPA: aconitate hydratase, partial [Solirubrobacterales bacterium]|nr:aconitate hydratase [Solirubrobacterales bacterium]
MADALVPLAIGSRSVLIAPIGGLGIGLDVGRLPYTLRVLLENVARAAALGVGDADEVQAVAAWQPTAAPTKEISFRPSRVLMQDFTGVPAIVDLAAMREALQALGGNPARVNPVLPAELVIDHSVQVDEFGTPTAMQHNLALEFERNRERYAFLRWGQRAFGNFRVVPPNTGIVHQVNLEYLARVVEVRDVDGRPLAFPDTLVGTDSHTTMINGLGVLGWGVGGIEAEAAMVGEAVSMLVPQVVGVKLTGTLPAGATATDLVLTITQRLRSIGVVGQFVEYFGEGLGRLPVADRATIGNMSPEYGATCGFFPVDDETLRYLRLTGRGDEHVELVERYCRAQRLFYEPGKEPAYTRVVELDLSTVEPSVAGPRRPQDRLPLGAVKQAFLTSLGTFGIGYGKQDQELATSFPASDPPKSAAPGGRVPSEEARPVVTASTSPPLDRAASEVSVRLGGASVPLSHGSVVIAAITSCTNTSNPSVMIAAGLLAKKAVARGLARKPWVKTSLAPGSKAVTEYYRRAGLASDLDTLGFATVGYGCTTCIGNSGPLPEPISRAVGEGDLVVCAVLSGNRNFEARIHPNLKANFLASPPLVVAYAIAGTVLKDLMTEPVGKGKGGKDVWLGDIWPTSDEIAALMKYAMNGKAFKANYDKVASEPGPLWEKIRGVTGQVYNWPTSTYIAEPPFFAGFEMQPPPPPAAIQGARAMGLFGDSITTDHISPAGAIKESSPAGLWLKENGVTKADFNSYGSRRGNHDVMMRGTFANVRIKNLMIPPGADGSREEGGVTLFQPSGEKMFIYDAAMKYIAEGTPTVVFGGEEYGTGSSRDWAAKGTQLLGVKAVVARSF